VRGRRLGRILSSLHRCRGSRELLSHGRDFHGDAKHFGHCRLSALLLCFFFRLPAGLDRFCDPTCLGLLCLSPSFRLPGPLPGLGFGEPSSLGLFGLAKRFGLRRCNATLFVFRCPSSRLLHGFSPSFLSRGFAPSVFFGRPLCFFCGRTLRFFGS